MELFQREVLIRMLLTGLLVILPLLYLLTGSRKVGAKLKTWRTSVYGDYQQREVERQHSLEELAGKVQNQPKPPKAQNFIEKEQKELDIHIPPPPAPVTQVIKVEIEREEPSATIILTDSETKEKIRAIKNQAVRLKDKDIASYERKINEGLALDAENLDLLTMLADHFFSIKQYSKSMTLLKKILESNPNNHRAMWQMGEIYIDQGNINMAELMIEQAIKLENNNPKYLYSMVDIKYNAGNIDDSIYLMEKILKLRPTNVEYLIATAMLYEKNKNLKIAKKYYFEVLEFDPDNRTAKARLKAL